MEICYHLRLERKPISDYWEYLAHFPSIYYLVFFHNHLKITFRLEHNEAHIAQTKQAENEPETETKTEVKVEVEASWKWRNSLVGSRQHLLATPHKTDA